MMSNISFSDIAPNVALTYFVMRFLTIYLETEKRLPHLHKILKFSWLWAVILLAICDLLDLKFIDHHYNLLLSLAVLWLLNKSREVPITRMLAISFIPFAMVLFSNAFFELLTPKFHEANKSFFDSINGFAFTWVIGFSIYAQRQGKRERKQRLKEEEERAILEGKKQELEYQVAERTAELTKQKESLELALEKIKTTQTQLVHAEKMASLGELTAGIAHEIQNPLNFVNNFSEVSVELIGEVLEERSKDVEKRDDELINEILTDLSENLKKITHHGGRASNIIKGMLQHSRTSTGQKELTDINALCDEYLRLSYHGLRAKDKSFNADFKLIADPNLPKIEVVPQDFGRVILNMVNNAFYAVHNVGRVQNPTNVQPPQVMVSTQKSDNQIIIKITDNGTGMSEATKAKIFQPFFTTKPTGQGTGLGLSLAYDIVTKGHDGTLEVESEVNIGTTFTIKLPINN